jgi:hypothetical protein
MSAGSRLLIYVWLAGAANALAADPALSVNADDRAGASSSDDLVYAAAFNPFASVGTALDQPPVEAPAQSGDWAWSTSASWFASFSTSQRVGLRQQ